MRVCFTPSRRHRPCPYGEGRCVVGGRVTTALVFVRSAANKQGQASLRDNCFSVGEEQSCMASETQRSAAECGGFCSLSEELGPCDGHGACVSAVQTAGPGEGFVCECEEGYVAVNSSSGPTCSRPPPPPSSSLSTSALAGIAVGSAAALALLLALIVVVIWPKQRSQPLPLSPNVRFFYSPFVLFTLPPTVPSFRFPSHFPCPISLPPTFPSSHLLLIPFALAPPISSSPCPFLPSSLPSLLMMSPVRAMASLQHENVVRLMGFCLHQSVESGRQEQVLVYEYVPHGDLKHHIHHSKCECRSRAKIADFGLLKLLSHADGGDERTRVAGTPGYLYPDYNRTHVVSEKSDVYRANQ
ncbi:unnamed protein product [Closterium sp. Naga37s-1]|nr:unnamed protein product [Closterium sp. Naga37s-1]